MRDAQPIVLHLVTALSWRGGEQQVAYLIDELSSKVKQLVLCSKGSEMEQYCKTNKINYVAQPKRGGFDLAFAKKLKNICQTEAVDLCHLHDAHAHTYAILAAVLFGNKSRLILSRRVDFPINKNWWSFFKYNHHSIIKILCVSKTIKEITAPQIRDQLKLEVVYSGIDLNKFQERTNKLRKELQLTSDQFLVGNTSALADHKDYFTFIDVAEKVLQQTEKVQFVIIGDGPMKAELMSYASEKKLGSSLHFLGFITDVPEILADLDLFMITSKTEGLGTSILDAFAAGVPVLATAGGGIKELVVDGETGALCPVKAVDCLVEKLNLLQLDDALRTKLARTAKLKVKKFSKTETAKATLEHYHDALS